MPDVKILEITLIFSINYPRSWKTDPNNERLN